MELREAAASLKALQLVSEFKGSFKDIRYTLHPDGLSGELAGKGSNLAWATRSVWMGMRPNTGNSAEEKGSIIDERRSIIDERTRTVITVMDSDTTATYSLSALSPTLTANFAADYFEAVTCKFASATSATRCSFHLSVAPGRQALQHVPVGVRVTDIFWAMGGLSTLYEGSSAKIPTSAYSVSLCLAESVGGWDPDTFAPMITFSFMQLRSVRHLWGSLDIAYTLHRILTGDLKRHPDLSDAADQPDHASTSRRYGRLLGSPDSEGRFPGYDYHTDKAIPFIVPESPTEALLNAYEKQYSLPPTLVEEGNGDSLADHVYKLLPLLTMLYRIYEACLMMG
ncbi:hypothetical protein QFC19_000683 [Naganishia cerealis]|uniref:Uncharacterized protein n=1 Tax=Naganishia cerealis TaxID=610337 RepID=A0ACC2WMH5_9TREE|nr:hypothetical protein QFC19_000683 [Naganishia cerealis]